MIQPRVFVYLGLVAAALATWAACTHRCFASICFICAVLGCLFKK